MAQTISITKPSTTTSRWWAKPGRQILFYLILLVLWDRLARSGLWPSYDFAGPLDVWSTLVSGIKDHTILTAIGVSLARLAIGYGISVVLGVSLGLLIGLNHYVEETLGSLVMGLQALPSVCWIPFALLWFGLTEKAMIFVVIMGALFSITLGVEDGVKNTPPIYLKAARNMGTRGVSLALRVILPAALPQVMTGLKQGWTFAWRSLMAGELLYATLSLGNLLEQGRDYTNVPLMFAIMIVIIILGIAIDGVIFSPIERSIRRRWGLVR